MAKKTKISQEDILAFHKAIAGVKPLNLKKKVRLEQPKSRQKPVKPRQMEEESFHFSEAEDLPKVSGEEFIAYKQPSISNKTLRKLRKGQYNVEAILDLHGESVEKAITAVNRFLQQCLRDHIRVVLIIHGKGHHHSQMPILKNKLNHWLREINVVLAFCSADPSHGSRGAIYVLLKSTTEEDF